MEISTFKFQVAPKRVFELHHHYLQMNTKSSSRTRPTTSSITNRELRKTDSILLQSATLQRRPSSASVFRLDSTLISHLEQRPSSASAFRLDSKLISPTKSKTTHHASKRDVTSTSIKYIRSEDSSTGFNIKQLEPKFKSSRPSSASQYHSNHFLFESWGPEPIPVLIAPAEPPCGSYYTRTEEEKEKLPDKLHMNGKSLSHCLLLYNEQDLKYLNYQCNMIQTIEFIEYTSNLIFLDFYNNQISKISGLNSARNLKILLLGKNRITKIQGLEFLLKLEIIDLQSNQISKIENITHLMDLKVINLEDNRIRHLCPLEGLSKVTDFNIRYNQLEGLQHIQDLVCLKNLVASYNNISSFDRISKSCLMQLMFSSALI